MVGWLARNIVQGVWQHWQSIKSIYNIHRLAIYICAQRKYTSNTPNWTCGVCRVEEVDTGGTWMDKLIIIYIFSNQPEQLRVQPFHYSN